MKCGCWCVNKIENQKKNKKEKTKKKNKKEKTKKNFFILCSVVWCSVVVLCSYIVLLCCVVI